jgi:hypothetical protein
VKPSSVDTVFFIPRLFVNIIFGNLDFKCSSVEVQKVPRGTALAVEIPARSRRIAFDFMGDVHLRLIVVVDDPGTGQGDAEMHRRVFVLTG